MEWRELTLLASPYVAVIAGYWISSCLSDVYHKFYKNDPSQIIKNNLSKIKKYQNGLIFTYKENNTIQSCYKGSVDVLTNKKNGNGELICIDGSQYIGLFYNNEFNGWNIYKSFRRNICRIFYK